MKVGLFIYDIIVGFASEQKMNFILYLTIIILTRKGFSEKPIVAFTNSTVFVLDFYIYI